MEIFLKRYFWVVNLLVIAACAFFAARGVNAVIAAKVLLTDGKKAQLAHLPRMQPPPISAPLNVKDEQAVIDRNVFCQACEPPKPVTVAPEVAFDPSHPQPTALPLVLIATSIAHKGDASFSSATVQNTSTLRSGMYWVHENIPDAGEVVSITPRWIDFRNSASGRVERLDLLGASAPPPPMASAPVATAPTPAGAGDDFAAELDRGIRKIDDTHFEVDRALVTKVISDPSIVMRQARIVPSMKDNQPNGLKMYAIKPNSAYARLGMQNGDTIHSINGFDLTSMDKGLEVYSKVKSASSLTINVTRRGQPVTLEYQIK